MRFSEITEAVADNIAVFYGGRFQPMHIAHQQVYDHLVSKFGTANVFIATTFSQKAQKAHAMKDFSSDPFTFDEKKSIMSKMHGIPADKIINTNPYRPDLAKIGRDPNKTAIVVVYSAKDAGRLGTGGVLQPYKDGELQPASDDRAYVYVAPEMQGGMSASDFRSAMSDPNNTDQAKAQVFKKFFGKFDDGVYNFINGRLNAN